RKTARRLDVAEFVDRGDYLGNLGVLYLLCAGAKQKLWRLGRGSALVVVAYAALTFDCDSGSGLAGPQTVGPRPRLPPPGHVGIFSQLPRLEPLAASLVV